MLVLWSNCALWVWLQEITDRECFWNLSAHTCSSTRYPIWMKGMDALLLTAHLVSRQEQKGDWELYSAKRGSGIGFRGVGFLFGVFKSSSPLHHILADTVHWFCFNKEKKKVTCNFVKEQTVVQSKERKLIYHNHYLSSLSIMICVPQAICYIRYLQPNNIHANWRYTWGASSTATKQLCVSPTPTAALEGKN